MEEKGADALEMAAQKNEKRKKEKNEEIAQLERHLRNTNFKT